MDKTAPATTTIRNQKGFTLIELLFSMTILSVGILATTNMQYAFLKGNTKARMITEGSARLQQKIEELTGAPYDEADPLVTNGPLDDRTGDGAAGLNDTGADADSSETDGIYTYSWNVATDAPAAGLKTVNVIVQWNEKGTLHQMNSSFLKGDL